MGYLTAGAGCAKLMGTEKTYYDRNGVRRTLVVDESLPGAFGVKTEVDLERLIENNAALAEEALAHSPRSVNKLLARVPLTIYEQSVHEQWDEADWKRWLNDPDNAAFRVWKGQV